ncbi:hypothetical protein PHJA_000101700 [Phtheirospermum japonicum]|uniref:DUF4378 domain-containing protein n=1 Tax=Phtheirospermum japonicum TaxID=374723 RepID=A0A830B266_9LAMI|nr:hypothetical protein PHJA_000101700 [Phtheirospermum japonicum]
MKDCTDSVIARLLGFDELRTSHKPIREKQRVLSESYVRNAASVGLRPGSLVSTGRTRSTKNEIKNDDVFDKRVGSSASKLEKGVQSPRRHVLRSLQKYEHDSLAGDLGIDYMKKSLELGSVLEHVKLDRHSRQGYREHRKAAKPESGNKEPVVNGNVSCRHICIACTRAMNRISREERPRSKFDELSRTGHCLRDQSSLAKESRKRNPGRRKTAKEVQEVGVCVRGQNHDKTLALADKKSIPSLTSSSNPIYSSIDVWEDGYLKSLPLFNLEAIKKALSSGKQDESTAGGDDYSKKHKDGSGYEQFPGVNGDSMSLSSKMLESSNSDFSSFGEACTRGVQDGIDNGFEDDRCKEIELGQSNVDRQLESIPDILSRERGRSYVQEVSGDEAFLNEYSEEESSAYSNCSRICPKRTFQQSPDSVLEQFDMQNSSTFEHFDRIGLQLQLEALNFDSEETYSEGSVILLSGDDDSVERFDDLSHNGRIVKTWFRDSKSRSSSYMVDVLDEAGAFMDINAWYSLDCPICPSVFEALEKKYGKQTSWQRSERRLLFDRINSGLISIFSPVINFHTCATSIRSRVCACLRRDEVEDELWTMLISLDEETSKDLSEKALDKWFATEEGVDIICGELENALFDELMMELASLWDFDE